MISKEKAQALYKKHGSLRKAAGAASLPYSTFYDILHGKHKTQVAKPRDEMREVAGRSLKEFRSQFDKRYIVPKRIKDALKALGDGWEFEPVFAKIANVSLTDLHAFRDDFAAYVVVVNREGKRAWAGKPSVAARMREMIQ